jgi:hypothetical protein
MEVASFLAALTSQKGVGRTAAAVVVGVDVAAAAAAVAVAVAVAVGAAAAAAAASSLAASVVAETFSVGCAVDAEGTSWLSVALE